MQALSIFFCVWLYHSFSYLTDDTHQFDQEWQKRSHQASIRLHPSHHSRTLPSLDMPTDRGHAHRHHPYGVPQHRRPPTSRLESLGSDLGPSAHGSGIGQPSKKHDSPLAGEQRRHKKVKGAMKEVHFWTLPTESYWHSRCVYMYVLCYTIVQCLHVLYPFCCTVLICVIEILPFLVQIV